MISAPLVLPELLTAPRNRWDQAIASLLAALLAFMPLAFGAVEAWSELVVVGLAATLSMFVALRVAIDRTFQPPWSWAYVPLLLFVAATSLQLAPLPPVALSVVSPSSANVRAELLGAKDAAAADSTISMYPPATAHGLRMLLVGVAVFFVTAATFRSKPQIKRLLAIVFAVGCVEAALALVQIATRADKIYWTVNAGTSRLTSGSFVNYSNFCQFMNLSMGAGVALLLVRLHEERGKSGRGDEPARPFGGARLSQHSALLAGLVLCAVAVLTSLSRNGALSMTIAAAIVGTALWLRGTLGRRGWVFVMLPLGALAAMLLVDFDAIYERLATLKSREQLASRWELTLGALRVWQEFPIWGAGLGTHEFVFPMFDQSTSPQLAEHVDNDYAQLLEEMGVVGAALVAAFLAVIGGLLVRLCLRGRTPLSTAAFGLAFGLLAAAIHSATDFGQHIPAVFCLSAVACGVTVQLARLEFGGSSARRTLVAARRWTAAAILVGLAALWGWALRGAYNAHLGEQWWAAALQVEGEIRQLGPEATDADYADLLTAAERACDKEPSNVLYAYWLNAYRWETLGRKVGASTGRVRLPDESRTLVARIADEFAATRQLCPTFGPTYALEGQLRLLVLGDARGAELIAKGVRLAPYDAPTCLAAGEASARAGRVEDAASLLLRTVALAPALYSDAIEIALFVSKRPDIARELAGDDFRRLEQLAEIAAASEEFVPLTGELHAAAEAALRRCVASGAATPLDLAALAAIEARHGALDAAIDLYETALKADYGQLDWRLARARALVAVGREKDALQEARRCLRLRPGHPVATTLVDELSSPRSERSHELTD